MIESDQPTCCLSQRVRLAVGWIFHIRPAAFFLPGIYYTTSRVYTLIFIYAFMILYLAYGFFAYLYPL